jgi:hypothetical protein
MPLGVTTKIWVVGGDHSDDQSGIDLQPTYDPSKDECSVHEINPESNVLGENVYLQ